MDGKWERSRKKESRFETQKISAHSSLVEQTLSKRTLSAANCVNALTALISQTPGAFKGRQWRNTLKQTHESKPTKFLYRRVRNSTLPSAATLPATNCESAWAVCDETKRASPR
ncbi:hypothetical protein KC19_11G106000 [Ceratodon purpureus]|uniref:Uncharacterized protein n=1 Tax=Ceratodon purpureus TaxID=3225 RepID=A0A8T0GG42_CERPU|nr:hypothetical protein KC19_11G106000 [Ceratodon purpureus]